jgi:type VI secretion system secreted protein VgrG
MEHQVIADIEIEDERINYYSSIIIRQQFNAHHEFSIRIKYDVLEKIGAFNLSTAQKKIGKLAIIKLRRSDSAEPMYEFRGVVCEVCMEQSDNFASNLVLKGYSPTILLENGPHLLSFYQKGLQPIVDELTQPLSQYSCRVNITPKHTSTLKYICQYRESTFHFLNRLSSDFGEMCYYDGIDFYFGKPSSSPNIEIIYGEDVHQLQLKLRILPLSFNGYSYLSKDDELIQSEAPSSVDGLDEYANHALQESNKIFSEPVSFPLRQRVESKGELDEFVKKQKQSMATELEVLSGSSDNPCVCIGAIADVKISTRENNALSQEEYGKFLITSIEHHLTENKKYYNSFEAIPAGTEMVPVKNVIMPIAEPQVAIVTDNNDPDDMGRVKVQMLWQQESNEMTDWIWVMTPDAGGGKSGAKNRGFVVVPEVDDQVLVAFRYNDPDRPFVLGSLFHGKTGGGGGQGNKIKSLTALSGSTITLDGDSISIIDAQSNSIIFNGSGKIDIKSNESISLTCGSSEVIMKSDGKIEIKGTEVTITGTSKATMESTASFVAEGTSATVHGTSTEVKGDAKVEVSSPATTVKGEANLKLQSTGTVDMEGTAMTNVKGGVVNLN